MTAHRFMDLLNDQENHGSKTAPERANGFLACPILLTAAVFPQLQWQQQVYLRAYAEAQAVVRPAITERLRIDFAN